MPQPAADVSTMNLQSLFQKMGDGTTGMISSGNASPVGASSQQEIAQQQRELPDPLEDRGDFDRYAYFFKPARAAEPKPEQRLESSDAGSPRGEMNYTHWTETQRLLHTHEVDRYYEARKVNQSVKREQNLRAKEAVNLGAPSGSAESSESEAEREDRGGLLTGRSVLTPQGVYDQYLAKIRKAKTAVMKKSAAAQEEEEVAIESMPMRDHPRPGSILDRNTEEPEEEEDTPLQERHPTDLRSRRRRSSTLSSKVP